MKFTAFIVGALAAQASAFSFQRPAVGGLKALSAATLEASESVAAPKVVDAAVANVSDAITDTAVAEEIEMSFPVGAKDTRVLPGRYNDLESSIALPFLERPTALDGSHAGDYGFDPLGLSEKLDFYSMQESEIRHSRLAMLAVIGWPMSELLGPQWMLQHGCAPSVLNGFNPLSFLAVAAFFGAAGFFEVKTSLRSHQDSKFGKMHTEDMSAVWKYGVAGDYNFDPLGLYSSCGDDYKGRKGLRDVEVSHGRVAMLGITYFAAWEALTGHAIVENSMFFHPNLMLPLLVAGYTGFNQIYEVTPLDQSPVELRYTSEGEMKLQRLQKGASELFANAGAQEVFENASKNTGGSSSSLSDAPQKLSELNEQFGIGEKLSKVPKKISDSLKSFAGDTVW